MLTRFIILLFSLFIISCISETPILTPKLSATPAPTTISTLVATQVLTPTPVPTPTLIPAPTLTPTPTPTLAVIPALLELHDTQNTQWLKRAYRDLYRQIQWFAWVQDGLSSLETNTIDELLYIGAGEIDSLREILNLPWVQDDILEREYEVIDRLGLLGYHDTGNLTSVLSLPWVQDAISETEYDIIYWLASVSYDDEKAVAAVIAMPFLESPDTGDVLAIAGINTLAYEGLTKSLMDHPTFQEGITDAQTTLVAATGAVLDAEEIGRLLDPGYATVETVSSGTELTPDLKISIVRTGTQSRPGTVEAVKDAVAVVERVMGLPLPVDHVILVLNDHAVTSDYAGTNYGFAVGYLPEYEQRQDSYEWRSLQAGLVHEVAHYFWSGHAGWIDEGMANMAEYMYGLDNGLSRGQLNPHRKDCEAHDLAMLSEWDPDASSSRYLCNYYLGQGLFQELLESLGDEGFGKRLRKLYQLSLTEQESDWIPGIAEVRQVFSEQAAIIDRHWSGKLNAPDNLPYDAGIDLTSHGLIQWDQYPTYDGRSVTFKGTLIDEAILENNRPDLGGMQNFTLFSVDELKYPGSILSPLTDGAGWDLSNTGSVVANTYRIYQADGTFHVEFSFPTVLGNPSDYAITVWGFQDASQTPTISENADILGYARIRIP